MPVKARWTIVAFELQNFIRSNKYLQNFTLPFGFFDQICPKKGVSDQTQKKWTPPLNPAYSIRIASKFSIKLTILTFWTKFSPKRVCLIGNKKKWTSPLKFAPVFELVQVPNFSSNWQFWPSGPNLIKKGIYDQKLKRWTPLLNSVYSN